MSNDKRSVNANSIGQAQKTGEIQGNDQAGRLHHGHEK